MPRGAKRITLSNGDKYYSKQSNARMTVITADVSHSFNVAEWFEGTTEAEKNNITWLYEDSARTKVLKQSKTGVPVLKTLSIPKKLCGPVPLYYLEASITGLMDKSVNSGLLIRGYSQPLIKSSKWSSTKGGERLGTTPIRQGDDVFLNVVTEGFNGTKFRLEIIQRKVFTDLPIYVYTHVPCRNGEINLWLRDTALWRDKLKSGPPIAELYIQLRDENNNVYALDDAKSQIHGRFLRVKNELSTRATATPENVTIAKVGEPEKNTSRVDHCKFTKIQITDEGIPVTMFDEGKIKMQGQKTSEFYLSEKINYNFDEYKIRPQDKKFLENIANILMEMPYIPVELGSHTDRFGSEKYNIELSEKRAKAAMDYLISRNVDPGRITSKGYGKSSLLNKDPNLSREDSVVNRRTTLRLKIYAHDAASLEFETIGPGESKKKELPVKIAEFKTDGVCNLRSNPHPHYVPYGNLVPKKGPTALKLQGDETIRPKIYSPLDDRAHAYDYIWPMARSPYTFYYYINSCRYFTDKEKYSLLVKTYSDIRWTLTFYLNLTNDLGVSWTALSASDHKAMQSKAGKLGAERRWKQKDATFGFSLKSEWNKAGGAYGSSDEFTKEHEGRFKKLFTMFSAFGDLADGIMAGTKGTVRNLPIKGIPMKFQVKPPNLSLTGIWKLARAKKRDAPIAKIGTEIDIKLKADPLIGLDITIDLIGAAVGLAAGAISGGSAAPGAVKLYNQIKEKMSKGLDLGNDDVGFKANVEFYMNLVISNTIKTSIGFNFNTSSDKINKAALEATNTLRVTLDCKIFIQGELAMVVVSVNGYFEAKATATAAITFGSALNYDTKGLYYRPELGFDGLDASYTITASAGLAVKKSIPPNELIKDKEGKWVIAEGDYNQIIPKFNIVEKLENLFGTSFNVPLMRNED